MRYALMIGCLVLGGCPAEPPPYDPSATGDPSPPRGTIVTALDVVQMRVEVFRNGAFAEEAVDEEAFLEPGNRVKLYATVENESDGWWPVNFELCVDHADSVAVLHPNYDFTDPAAAFPDEPCFVYWMDEAWPISHRGTTEEFRAGGIEALDEPAAGYLTVYFRVEMPDGALLDIIEYSYPYRVMRDDDGAGRTVPVVMLGAPRMRRCDVAAQLAPHATPTPRCP
ncbi:MAG: hypothetical protein Q7T01_03515 [bacterium]|nr:hypothetical protein [bacterium]